MATRFPKVSEEPFLSVSDLRDVFRELFHMRSKWRQLGLELDLAPGTLDAIEQESLKPDNRLERVLHEWLNSGSATWRQLVEALESHTVNEKSLARKLRERHLTEKLAGSTSKSTRELPSSDDAEQLRYDIKSMKIRFARLQTKTIKSISKRNVPLKRLISLLSAYRTFSAVLEREEEKLLADYQEELKAAGSVDEIFTIMSPFLSFLDYDILEDIIDNKDLGANSDRKNLAEYITSLKEFLNSWNVKPCKVCHDESALSRSRAKLCFKLDTDSLSMYRDVKIAVARILNIEVRALQLHSVEEGCLELVFLFPRIAVSSILPLKSLSGRLSEVKPQVHKVSLVDGNTTESAVIKHGMATLSPESIEIEGEWHALDKIPDQKSAVVLREREKLLRAIGLKALVQDLGRIGGFICIAYNGAGAAGFKYTENQIEIQRLGYDITKLCDKSALTVAKFKKASSIILNDLQSTYEYLLDNLEEMAVHTFSNISDIAEEMQKAAEDLREEFEKEEKKIIEILENTQKTRQGAAEEIKELSMKRSQLESEKKQELQLIKEHQEKEREAEASRRELELQEDRAVSEIGELNPLKALVNVFTSVIAGVCVFSTDGAEKKAEAYRKKRLEALEAEQSIQEMRHEALAKMESFTAKIALCGEDQNMAECAVDALHEAAGALKHLSAVMMQAASFWEQMKDHCQSLAKKEMRSRVEEVLRYSEDKRLKVWTSKAFKRQAVQFCASWVALCAICIDYMEQIKQTKKDLYRYISENPTWEESRKNLQQLTKSFLSNLQQDQKALTDQEFRAQVEIKALEKQNLK